ncbi:MAG: hypothetical protein ACFFDB_00615 [Promethearchaeota archaeon]
MKNISKITCIVCGKEILDNEKRVNLFIFDNKPSSSYHLKHFISYFSSRFELAEDLEISKSEINKIKKDIEIMMEIGVTKNDLGETVSETFLDDINLAFEKEFIPWLYKTFINWSKYCDKINLETNLMNCLKCDKNFNCSFDFYIGKSRE